MEQVLLPQTQSLRAILAADKSGRQAVVLLECFSEHLLPKLRKQQKTKVIKVRSIQFKVNTKQVKIKTQLIKGLDYL